MMGCGLFHSFCLQPPKRCFSAWVCFLCLHSLKEQQQQQKISVRACLAANDVHQHDASEIQCHVTPRYSENQRKRHQPVSLWGLEMFVHINIRRFHHKIKGNWFSCLSTFYYINSFRKISLYFLICSTPNNLELYIYSVLTRHTTLYCFNLFFYFSIFLFLWKFKHVFNVILSCFDQAASNHCWIIANTWQIWHTFSSFINVNLHLFFVKKLP